MSLTVIIALVTVAVSFLAFNNRDLTRKLIFNAHVIKYRNEWHRLITSGFIHSDFMHLLINMIVFYSFGQVVEQYFGIIFGGKARLNFLLLYFGALVISSAPSFAKHKDNPAFNSLGASGAVAAVVFAAILMDPMSNIYIWGLIGLPGILLGIAYVIYSVYMSRKGGDFINHDAHLWGAIFGFLFTGLLKPSLFLNFFSQILNYFT